MPNGRLGLAQDRVDCDGVTLDDSDFSQPIVRDQRDTRRGALHNPTGHPLGGGEGYGGWVPRPKSVVRTRQELVAALASARPGDVVYVDDQAAIDLSQPVRDHREGADPCLDFGLGIPAGVTLASGRGRDGSLGALLSTTSFGGSCALLVPLGDGVRITGLRLRGPDTGIEQDQAERCFQEPNGILVTFADDQPPARWNVEIDNNEMFGWPRAAVEVRRVMGVRVHHNLIHYNRRQEHDGTCPRDYGLGYGVVVGPGSAVIEGNVFDHNRHDIASDGRAGARYQATYNLILAGAVQHSFDVHGGKDRGDCTDVAGSSFVVHDNTFLQAHKPAFRIRGIPLAGAWVYRNETRDDDNDDAFNQVNASGHFHVHENDSHRNHFPAWFISFSGDSFWAWRRFDATSMSQVAVGNFDGEGGADVFRTTCSEWQVSSGARGEWTYLNTSSIGLPRLAFGDFVGDAKTDVFRATGSEWLVSESGSGQWVHLNTSSIGLARLAFGDFVGDARTDVFRATGSKWQVSESGSGQWSDLNISSIGVSSLAFGNFVGDAKTDVFRATGSKWQVSESGRGQWSDLNTSSIRLPELAFADVDGDGRTDVLRAANGRWYLSSGGNSAWMELNRSDLSMSQLRFGDFNGDGKADALSSQSPAP